jgi:predicted ATP-grasp superfamily ATP-dependent carboligase
MIILVIGISVRNIACSAARAGHKVIAMDSYCDVDLERCAEKWALISHDFGEESLQECIDRSSPDAVVLGPGLEEMSVKGVLVLNNTQWRIAQVSDKLWIARWLENRGFPTIPTQISVEGMGRPAVIKPRKGAGGEGCRLIRDGNELKLEEGEIIQSFVEGLPASVSVIGNGRDAKAIAVNEQLIGASWTGAGGFRYSGNITPLEAPSQGIARMAEEIVSELELVGSNGVDFLLTARGPVVVEVNPRFQGSLDTVELSMGVNVFKAHLDSFEGLLPAKIEPRRTAGRAIIYADDDLRIEENLSGSVEGMTDIPRVGSMIKKDDPIASIIALGTGREDVLCKLRDGATALRRRLQKLQAIHSSLREVGY